MRILFINININIPVIKGGIRVIAWENEQPPFEFITVPALHIKQNEYELFIFAIEAGTLYELAYFSTREIDRETGVERPHSQRRSTQIWNFLRSEDATLPNNIIVSLRYEEKIGQGSKPQYDEGKKLLMLPKIPELAFVIDGQHRLRAFQHAKNQDPSLLNFPLIVTAFIDLPLAKIAEVFVNINYYQKPVSKSLVYDLVGISPEVFPDFFSYHHVTRYFNDTLKSPWFCQIKMLGVGQGIITQATFIEALQENQILSLLEPLDEHSKINILWAYFEFLQQTFQKFWCNKAYNLCKSVGFHAQMKFLAKLLKEQRIQPESLKGLSREKIVSQIRHVIRFDSFSNLDFGDNRIRSLVGKKGARELFNILVKVGLNDDSGEAY